MKPALLFLAFSIIIITINVVKGQNCEDSNNNCQDWVTSHASLCQTTDYIIKTCRKSCGYCTRKVEPRFNVSRVPSHLQSIAWLIGIWQSNHGGKAIFPTIPTFTYGEQVKISLSDEHMTGLEALNYTAFAWGLSRQEELHSEYGYITVDPNTRIVSLTTVMNNGFVTVEEGIVEPNRIEFHLEDIGRISFSRDLPVLQLVREWTLLDKNTLQARLNMETLTHGMQEHTFIRYRRIYP
uniref:ShKT domain-containing protein n=1 Tax=Onchocerca volvulus TaxID=6282 RepID=A0A2K6VG54_ONCVO